jgi:hypothetical protein
MTEREEKMEEALKSIAQWAEAYPLDAFPEPDLKKARDLLEAGGVSLGALVASGIRHVVGSVGKIASEALK